MQVGENMYCSYCKKEVEEGQHYVPFGGMNGQHVGCCAEDDKRTYLQTRQTYDTFVRGSLMDSITNR